MIYINKEARADIARLLVESLNTAVRYKNKQKPHPKNGIDIRRCIAEVRIQRLKELIALVSPDLVEVLAKRSK